MSERKDKAVTDRRDFLKLAGFGAAASAVAVVIGEKDAEAKAGTDSDRSGYRETEHVKKYYELARF